MEEERGVPVPTLSTVSPTGLPVTNTCTYEIGVPFCNCTTLYRVSRRRRFKSTPKKHAKIGTVNTNVT